MHLSPTIIESTKVVAVVVLGQVVVGKVWIEVQNENGPEAATMRYDRFLHLGQVGNLRVCLRSVGALRGCLHRRFSLQESIPSLTGGSYSHGCPTENKHLASTLEIWSLRFNCGPSLVDTSWWPMTPGRRG